MTVSTFTAAEQGRGYLDLMKLRVVELLLVTTVPALVLAEGKLPGLVVTAASIIGGTLAAGAANAYNMIIESDIDKLMARTAKRPLVTGVLNKVQATVFATIVAILSLVIFWVFTTPLATLLTLIAIVFYVVVYTMGLKRRTAQNIVWGGAAGCMPVFIGWAAVTNSLSWTAVAFFMVIFFWTPPHFWALALRIGADYAAAGVPMLPVTAGPAETARQIWLSIFGLRLSHGITRIRFTLGSLLLRIGKSPTKADALTLFCVPCSSYACRSVGHQPLAKTAARAKQRPSFF